MERRVRRAAQCAFGIQEELHNCELAEEVRLSVKIGIGMGKVSVLHLGGVYKRMEYIAVGEPLLEAFIAEHHATPGDVSPGVYGCGVCPPACFFFFLVWGVWLVCLLVGRLFACCVLFVCLFGMLFAFLFLCLFARLLLVCCRLSAWPLCLPALLARLLVSSPSAC